MFGRDLALYALCLFSANAFHVQRTHSSPENRHANLALSKRQSGDFSDDSNISTRGLTHSIAQAAVTAAIVVAATVAPAHADGNTKEFKLPPIDYADKSRCVLKSSSMGQANAARDKLYDLRECKIAGANARGFDLSGVIMKDTDLSNANLQDAYFSKSYIHESKLDGADFSNGIVDRASFTGSSLKGTLFVNSVLTSTSFDDANVEGADFTEAAMGDFDIKRLCRNPTLKGTNPTTGADTRESVGCPN